MMTIDEIKRLANTNPKFTKQLKDTLIAEADKYGIAVPQCKCRNRWTDLVLAIYHAKKKEIESNTTEDEKVQNKAVSVSFRRNIAYRYKHRTAVRINGKVYDEKSTLGDVISLRKHNKTLCDRYFDIIEDK